MNQQEIRHTMLGLKGKTIRMLEGIEELGDGPEKDMLFSVLSVEVVCAGLEDEHYGITFDIVEYEDHNTRLMTPNYYDDNRNPCLTWKESSSWPKHGRETIYVHPDAIGHYFEITDGPANAVTFPVEGGWYWMSLIINGEGERPQLVEYRDGWTVVKTSDGRGWVKEALKENDARFIKIEEPTLTEFR